MATGSRLWSLSLKWGEMCAASSYVVHRRAGLMHDAALNPLSADMAELGRMVPEKAEALGRGLARASRARDPIEAAEALLAPLHQRATANARRLRGAGG